MSRVTENDLAYPRFTVPQKGFQAPQIELRSLDGELVSLSDLQGKVVILNLWASWCLPCRAEMPTLQTIYDDYNQQGVEILAINATNQDDLENVLSFVDNFKVTFPILLDTNGEASRAYYLTSLPTTFFINKTGLISDVVVGGPMSEALLRVRVENLIQDLD